MTTGEIPAARVMAVTGATGMLGAHLATYFNERGWRVRSLVRSTSSPTVPAGTEAHRFELPDELEDAALANVQVLVHCAATTRSNEVTSTADEEGARCLIERARAAGVETIVFPSSTSARADAPSPYGRNKFAIENMLDPERDVALRLGLVLSGEGGGLFRRLVDWIRNARVIPLIGGGQQVVQPIHVDDVCRAVEGALERGSRGTLVVADPDGIPFRAFLEEIAQRSARRVWFVPVPAAPILLVLRTLEALRVRFPVTSENVLGLREQRFLDSRDDLERLGVPARSVGDALDRALDG